MKKSHKLELLILLFAGIGGIVSWNIDKWYFALPIATLLFAGCSTLVTWLKEETIKEYLEAVRNLKDRSNNGK